MQDKNTKAPFERSGSTKKNIRFEDDLLDQINRAAGNGQFSSWVKEACREKLERLESIKK
ncbi:YlcI/YnfO family protein [Leclercia sp.]|uniref:YlcI/YnfO family protein n=1 Tax=Leclercia sp. TaxID=1898428 RepID=UPI0028A04098|nr:YlcI/YnfO family protein [Leclercia sp.]